MLAGVPALLGQMAYSRDVEREADPESSAVLRAAGLSPEVMVELFERARSGWAAGATTPTGIALAWHPADAERVALFREAARR